MGGLTADQVVLMIVAISGVLALVALLLYRLASQGVIGKKQVPETDVLGLRVLYESRESATRAISEEVKQDIYFHNYFPVKVKCANCHLSGPLLIPKGQRTDEESCPKCLVPLLEVTSPSTNGDKPLFYPILPEELEEKVEMEVDRLVEEAWSVGKIRRTEGMFH